MAQHIIGDCSTGEVTQVALTPEEEAARTPTLEARRAACLAALGARRWLETQTFTYDGVVTKADAAIAVVNATVTLMNLPGGPASVNWKLADGEFRTFDLAAMVAFGVAVGSHIQGCFDHEADLTADILASDNPESVDIAAGW